MKKIEKGMKPGPIDYVCAGTGEGWSSAEHSGSFEVLDITENEDGSADMTFSLDGATQEERDVIMSMGIKYLLMKAAYGATDEDFSRWAQQGKVADEMGIQISTYGQPTG